MGNTFRNPQLEHCNKDVTKIKKYIAEYETEIAALKQDIKNIKEDNEITGGMFTNRLKNCIHHKKQLNTELDILELELEELNLELKSEMNKKLETRTRKSSQSPKTRKSSQSPKPTT